MVKALRSWWQARREAKRRRIARAERAHLAKRLRELRERSM